MAVIELTKVLAIYGASGLGREVLELARIINAQKSKWDKFIFIDDDSQLPHFINDCEVLLFEEALEKYGDSLEIAMGVGEPVNREKLFEKIKSQGIPTPTLIHPGVHIPDSTSIGNGVIIQYGCFISCDVHIGDYVFIQPQCNIGHDDILEKGCMISGFSNVGGIVRIGCWSFLGLSCAVKQSVKIGAYAVIGMGAVVQKDIPDGMVALGNPARPIARNEGGNIFK